uniref:Uncharacterized protein n=1 Tax=Alexandrium catenella TaxID=2925 RepID=A0A7S1WUF4_ALECA
MGARSGLALGRAGSQKEEAAAPWVAATVAEARLVARLVLAANAFILALFPLIAIDKLILKGAYRLPFVQKFPLGSWVAGAAMPRLAELPLDTSLNPSLEVVELLIGWLQWVYVLQTARKPSSARPPAWLQEPGRGFVGSLALGGGMREAGNLGKRD